MAHGTGDKCEAERKLLVAVLKDAILSYRKNVGLGGARFKEAERWIFGKDTDRLFAFETIRWTHGKCTAVGAELVTFAAVKLCAGHHPTHRRCIT